MDLVALSGFAFAASITPGPNNLMLWASGLNYGIRRTMPHLIGVNLGFSSLLALIGLGLGAVIGAEPAVSMVIKVGGGIYLMYLAYRVATADPVVAPVQPPAAVVGAGGGVSPDPDGAARPLTFLQAIAFQYVNPKAWVMGTTAVGLATPEDRSSLASILLLVATFAAVNLPCIAVWVGAGNLVGRLLADERWRRRVNIALGALLAVSVVLLVA
jgi:threonine/homoserine/homoserine lactone efflux protein